MAKTSNVPSIAYVNGDFVPIADAHVSVLDRGFLFADGVYEVSAVINGRLVDNAAHMGRLKRSLAEMQLALPVALDAVPGLMQSLVDREEMTEGMIYLQVTRGAAGARGFEFPDADRVASSLVIFAQEKSLIDSPLAKSGATAITIPDIRWRRRDIKSVALLPQVLGKQMAADAGAFEAWMVEDGYITEGTSSAAGIITADKTLVTRPISNDVLDSITRRAMLAVVQATDLKTEERLFTPAEAYAAAEAFNASATALIMPIVEIDGHTIGDGKPGPYVTKLRDEYLRIALSDDPTMAQWN